MFSRMDLSCGRSIVHMRKSVIAACIGLGAASFLMLSGFDSAATPEDILSKTQQASADAKEFSATETLDASININVPSYNTSMGIMVKMDMDAGFIREPLKMGMNGDISMSMMGENQNIKMEMYMIQEDDGTFSLYSKTDEGSGDAQWTHSVSSKEDADQLISLLNSDEFKNFDYASLGINWELDSQPSSVNGASCYHLTTALTWDDMLNILRNIGEQAEQAEEINGMVDELSAYGQFLSGVKMVVAMDIDETSYLPLQMVIDFNETDWSTISSLVGSSFGTDENGNPIEVELSAEGLALTCVYDYNTPVTIEVPAEALQAPASSESAENALEDVLGGIAG